jgi:hypothetical protein
MSKLKEIIHQYVVEALEEILSEEVEEVEEGYKRQIRLAKLLQKDPSNEKLQADSNKAFNIGIGRVRRRIERRNAEYAQRASQTDPHDQNF